jgi:integrase
MGRERQYDGVRASSATSIEIDFYYAGKRCKERLKLQPTPANLKRADQHRSSILAAIEAGTFDYSVTFPTSKKAKNFSQFPEAIGLTVSMYLESWLEGKKRQLKASTYDDYRKIVANPLQESLGNIGLAALRRVEVKAMVKEMTCSNKRISNVLSVLRSALDDAVDDELIESNPIHEWSYQNQEAPKKESDVDPFSADEQALILSKCEGQFRNLVQFALWTGLRTSELVALNWSDIDWQRNVVVVSKAMTYAADAPEDTKTKSGRRSVKLLAPAMAALNAQKAHTLLKGIEIFQNPSHLERWSGDLAIRQSFWTRALKLAKVRYRRPYQTRHTFASMMLSAGENPMWVAQQMGHSDWGMIRRTYGKFMSDSEPDAGGKAESIYGNVDHNVDQATSNSL